MEPLSWSIAFAAGLLSFLSPCTLPLAPAFLTYLTGISTNQNAKTFAHTRLFMIHTLLFVAGFSVIFIAFGLSASMFGQLLNRHQTILRQAGGIIIILLGLHMTGLLSLPFLQRHLQIHMVKGKIGYWRSLLMGLIFALGWTPCCGPVLASILVLAANSSQAATGGYLLAIYAMGMGLPFLLAAVFWSYLHKMISRFTAIMPWVYRIGGICMIIVGLFMFFDLFPLLAVYFHTTIH